VLTEWTASDPTNSVFSGSSRELLRVEFPFHFHNFQEIAFRPGTQSGAPDHGLLFVCIGDGGSFRVGLFDNMHRLDSPLGTIFRIDPLGSNGRTGEYGIPTDNPWASDGDADTLDEIWAYGFRNPHRLSWDHRGAGTLLVGDIGKDNVEEVNLVVARGDYGWPAREGTFLLDAANSTVVFPLPEDDATFGYRYPVLQFDHDEGSSIVGGHVYRACLNPELDGIYLFGDIVNGRVFHADADVLQEGVQALIEEVSFTSSGTETTLRELVNQSRVDLRFGIDADGEIYVLTKADGKVRRLAATASDCESAIFRRGDGNADGLIDIVDALFVLFYLFAGSPTPDCEKSTDSDDSGSVDATDAVRVLLMLFGDRAPLPLPHTECGLDPTDDSRTCESGASCDP
jgi:glucose/arabinose dehydrogenase